jgi:DNA-binding transcriptional MerR regulator
MTTPHVLARPAPARPGPDHPGLVDLPADVLPDRTVTIQDAARLTGVPPHTLRWYERVGLVPHVERCPTGRRRFTRGNLRWIVLLRALRSTGMPVATLQSLTEHHTAGEVDRAVALVRTQRAQVLAVMSQLHRSMHVLDAVESHLHAPAAHDTAPLVPAG